MAQSTWTGMCHVRAVRGVYRSRSTPQMSERKGIYALDLSTAQIWAMEICRAWNTARARLIHGAMSGVMAADRPAPDINTSDISAMTKAVRRTPRPRYCLECNERGRGAFVPRTRRADDRQGKSRRRQPFWC